MITNQLHILSFWINFFNVIFINTIYLLQFIYRLKKKVKNVRFCLILPFSYFLQYIWKRKSERKTSAEIVFLLFTITCATWSCFQDLKNKAMTIRFQWIQSRKKSRQVEEVVVVESICLHDYARNSPMFVP